MKKKNEITYGTNGMEIKPVYQNLVEETPPVIIRGRVVQENIFQEVDEHTHALRKLSKEFNNNEMFQKHYSRV